MLTPPLCETLRECNVISERNIRESPFVRLPQELRDQIWQFLYETTCIYVHNFLDLQTPGKPLNRLYFVHCDTAFFSLIIDANAAAGYCGKLSRVRNPVSLVCRQFYHDTKILQFSGPTWCSRGDYNSWCDLVCFMEKALKSWQRQYIRKIAIALPIHNERNFGTNLLGRALTTAFPAVRQLYLHRPYLVNNHLRPGELPERTEWSLRFAKFYKAWTEAGVEIIHVDGTLLGDPATIAEDWSWNYYPYKGQHIYKWQLQQEMNQRYGEDAQA